ncbi:MFS transporter [Ornithinimicrobium sufpigmenti]|uniref:MFS transporter n=1 Tax=Ornithinimicrobium sufpigmenti TaxID=2508882 RepID=UPI0015E1AF60|nr:MULTISPECIES: MFS transporter [unclassified Ornithinimicrobium]
MQRILCNVSSAPSLGAAIRLFRLHLAGVGLGNLADGIVAGAVPLLAIALTRDPVLIGLVPTALWLPWLLGALLVGAVVDRTDRARLRRLALAARACVLGAGAGAALADVLTIWVLLGLCLAYAATELFSDLAASAMIPQLVAREDLPRANARVMGTERLMQEFVGQPIGGALVILGAGWVFGGAAAVVVLVVLLLGRLRRPEGFVAQRSTPATTATEEAVSVRQDLAEGLRLVLSHPVVRPFTVSAALTNFANTAYFSMFVLWAVGPGSAVGLEPWQFPILVAVLSAGAIAGSLVPSRWVVRAGEVRVMIGCWFVNSALLLVPVLVPTWWAIGTALVFIGATNMVSNVIGSSIRQRVVPARLLGRTGGATRTLIFGTMAIAGPVGGLVARELGLPTLFVGATVMALLVTAWVAARVDQGVVDRAEAALAEQEARSFV